jgi:hypothetical protein
VLVFTRHSVLGDPTPMQAAVAVCVSVLLAWASLTWIEAPVRRMSQADRRLLAGGLACILVTLGAAWVLVERTWWMKPPDARAQELLAGARDNNPYRMRCHGRFDYVIDYRDRCRFGDPSGPADTVVWGDSHGAELALAMGEAAGRVGRAVYQITSSTCPPAIGFEEPTRPLCAAHNDATLRSLVGDEKVVRVVLVARYEHYLKTQAAQFERGLRHSVEALAKAGKRVVLVEPFPTYAYPVPAALVALLRRGQSFERFAQPHETYERVQAPALAMIRELGRVPGVSVVDTGAILCGDGRCEVVSDRRPLYFDDNHLSMTGARRLAGRAGGLSPL